MIAPVKRPVTKNIDNEPLVLASQSPLATSSKCIMPRIFHLKSITYLVLKTAISIFFIVRIHCLCRRRSCDVSFSLLDSHYDYGSEVNQPQLSCKKACQKILKKNQSTKCYVLACSDLEINRILCKMLPVCYVGGRVKS